MANSNTTERYRCCGKHLDYPTPVIGTIKWRGREFWCPHCGAKYEFFDGFKYFQKTDELKARLEAFSKISKEYLTGKSMAYELYQKPDEPDANQDRVYRKPLYA